MWLDLVSNPGPLALESDAVFMQTGQGRLSSSVSHYGTYRFIGPHSEEVCHQC